MKDLYIISGIDPNSLSHARMGGQINKSIIKERIINYMKNECKKGYCPTHKDIQKRFRCLVKCYFPEGIRQIMGEAGITYQRKFANKTKEEKEKIRKQIIDYTNNRYQKGYKVTYRELTSQFKINLYSYFEDMETIRRSVDGN